MHPLSPDQQTAFDQMVSFICDPNKRTFVLEGYAGVGKSTLMQHFITKLSDIHKAFVLVNASDQAPDYALTATTHKAAENLSDITGEPVGTLHSYLGLRVHKDYATGKTCLKPRANFDMPTNVLIIVDEASTIENELLDFVYSRTVNCKVIFIGDPAQLTPIGYLTAPVFKRGFETVRLDKVHRNGGHILDLATNFRKVVETGNWFQFKPDGNDVVWCDRNEFNDRIVAEFTRPGWKAKDSKYLSYTNGRAIEYNRFIRSVQKGDPDFQVGDYASVNEYVENLELRVAFKTDQTVHITSISPETRFGVAGHVMGLNGIPMFVPTDRKLAAKTMARAREEGSWAAVREIEQWVDLRALFGQTVNKSQGSTYGKVFIDLDDISGASNGNLMARLLYVGTSRAKKQVVFTGDIA